MNARNFQEEILSLGVRRYSLSDPTKEAFLEIPREMFIHSISVDGKRWFRIDSSNLEGFLPLIYTDTPLLLFQKGDYVSTISQPTFVLYMIELLDLQKGMKVFELGTGSGWNAALMGHIVGPEGKVVSVEIIPQMYQEALVNLAQFDLPQVRIVLGDGNAGYEQEAPFDRAIFTAGSYDIPKVFFEQIKVGGKLLFVLKLHSRGDLLLLLERQETRFHVMKSIQCQFVAVTGEHAPIRNEELDDSIHFAQSIEIYPKEFAKNVKGIKTEHWVYCLK